MKAAIGWWGVTAIGHPIEQWDSIRRVVPHPQSESSITPRDTCKRRKTQRKREKHKTGEILVSEEKDKPWTSQTDDVIKI